jgi:hypothetical protein
MSAVFGCVEISIKRKVKGVVFTILACSLHNKRFHQPLLLQPLLHSPNREAVIREEEILRGPYSPISKSI